MLSSQTAFVQHLLSIVADSSTPLAASWQCTLAATTPLQSSIRWSTCSRVSAAVLLHQISPQSLPINLLSATLQSLHPQFLAQLTEYTGAMSQQLQSIGAPLGSLSSSSTSLTVEDDDKSISTAADAIDDDVDDPTQPLASSADRNHEYQAETLLQTTHTSMIDDLLSLKTAAEWLTNNATQTMKSLNAEGQLALFRNVMALARSPMQTNSNGEMWLIAMLQHHAPIWTESITHQFVASCIACQAACSNAMLSIGELPELKSLLQEVPQEAANCLEMFHAMKTNIPSASASSLKTTLSLYEDGWVQLLNSCCANNGAQLALPHRSFLCVLSVFCRQLIDMERDQLDQSASTAIDALECCLLTVTPSAAANSNSSSASLHFLLVESMIKFSHSTLASAASSIPVPALRACAASLDALIDMFSEDDALPEVARQTQLTAKLTALSGEFDRRINQRLFLIDQEDTEARRAAKDKKKKGQAAVELDTWASTQRQADREALIEMKDVAQNLRAFVQYRQRLGA